MRLLRALWKGQLPLVQAFWEFAIVYVALANLCATIAAFAVVAADLPAALAVAVFLLPVPYILVAVLGVWRSAAVYVGPPHWATLARIAAILWGGLMAVV
jgi:hypothetical protein